MKEIQFRVFKDGGEYMHECMACGRVGSFYSEPECNCVGFLEDVAEPDVAAALQEQLDQLAQLVSQLAIEVKQSQQVQAHNSTQKGYTLSAPVPGLNKQHNDMLRTAGTALKMLKEADAVRTASKSIQEHRRAENIEAAAMDISGVPNLKELKKRLGLD